jgi:hypothetical protein
MFPFLVCSLCKNVFYPHFIGTGTSCSPRTPSRKLLLAALFYSLASTVRFRLERSAPREEGHAIEDVVIRYVPLDESSLFKSNIFFEAAGTYLLTAVCRCSCCHVPQI